MAPRAYTAAVALLLRLSAAGVAGLSPPRALSVVGELAARAAGAPGAALGAAFAPGGAAGARGANQALKTEVLATLAPYGDPALGLPPDAAAAVDALCRELEARTPRRAPARDAASLYEALDGRWRVRWSDAPPPSNGALGPVRGAAFQSVDVQAARCAERSRARARAPRTLVRGVNRYVFARAPRPYPLQGT